MSTKRLLQLAIDTLSTDEALALLAKVHPHCDIVEVGTPLIIEEGLAALETLKKKFPDKQYLADVKIMDAGKIEAASAYGRGANIATVLAAADDKTVQGAIAAAREHRAKLMADLINVVDAPRRARELESMGVHIVCVHTGYDSQQAGGSPLEELKQVRAAVKCTVAVAGGLSIGTVAAAVGAGADIVVVGGGITNQPDPRASAQEIMRQLAEAKRWVSIPMR